MNLSTIDLNLLVAFDALLAEQSVTRTAGRLGLSQPAMSSALGRLRRLIDDPILVRTATRMVPTQRAVELVGPVRQILAQVELALSAPAPFDPASTRRRFRIATNDRSEEHTSELQSLMRISYAVFCLKKKKRYQITPRNTTNIPRD